MLLVCQARGVWRAEGSTNLIYIGGLRGRGSLQCAQGLGTGVAAVRPAGACSCGLGSREGTGVIIVQRESTFYCNYCSFRCVHALMFGEARPFVVCRRVCRTARSRTQYAGNSPAV